MVAKEQPLGVGIIGCGSVALSMHLNGWTRFAEKAHIVALFDTVRERAERFASYVEQAYGARAYEYELRAAQREQRGHDTAAAERLRQRAAAARAAGKRPRIYTDVDALLRDEEVDVAAVCTPHHLHAPLSAQALEAGKHVFSEGPMAINVEQADRAIDAWRRSGKHYTAQYYSRYFRGSRQAYRLARSGKLGQVLMGRGDAIWYANQAYYDNDPWRGTRAAGDRVFVHQGRYAMDLFLWVMEDTLQEVYAYAGTKTHQIEVEDNAAVQERFASGAYGQLMLSHSALAPGQRGAVERLEILGERASLAGIVNYSTEECELTISSPERGYADELRSLAAAEPPMPADGATTHYEAFFDAIRGGTPVLTTPESVREQVVLNRAIARSLAERQPVRLPFKPSDPFYGPVKGYDD